jgi:hypothetical protein
MKILISNFKLLLTFLAETRARCEQRLLGVWPDCEYSENSIRKSQDANICLVWFMQAEHPTHLPELRGRLLYRA